MFGILSRRRQSLTSRPVNRSSLQCERLDERVNPTTTVGFTADIWNVSGQFTYDETLIDFTDPEQVIPFNNLWFNSSPFGMFTADENPVEAEFHNGQFYAMEFGATPANPQVPHLNVEIVGQTATIEVETGANPNPVSTAQVNITVVSPTLTMDFANCTTGVSYKLLVYAWSTTGVLSTFTVNVAATNTTTDIRDAVKNALAADGLYVGADGNTRLTVGGKPGSRLDYIEMEPYFNLHPDGRPNRDNNLSGPSYVIDTDGVRLFVKGVLQNPQQ